jgi:hypothetical protein
MPRNFGVKRSISGLREMADGFWNDRDPNRRSVTPAPFVLIAIAMIVLLVAERLTR